MLLFTMLLTNLIGKEIDMYIKRFSIKKIFLFFSLITMIFNFSLFPSEISLKGSVHEDLSCLDCHSEKGSHFSYDDKKTIEYTKKVNCQDCHEDTYTLYITKDTHGIALANGNKEAPNCQNCHGSHNILPVSDPANRMSRKNQPDTCKNCHGKTEFNKSQGIFQKNMISKYKESIHYKAIEAGKKGATCTDCHNHHNIQPSTSTDSTVRREGIMKMCSTCHKKEADNYIRSTHYKALEHGNYDVPTCTTCHSDHDIGSFKNPNSVKGNLSQQSVCINCHENERMMARYGLDTVPVRSYKKSYHGLARLGSLDVSALCSDCHDPHKAFPKTNPLSRIHKDNLVETCGQCHGKVSENFAKSYSHYKLLDNPGTKIESLVKNIYILLIITVIGGMILFISIIWLRAIGQKIKNQRKLKQIRRINKFERISHIVLFITFVLLVITGFALKFPESFWAKAIYSIGLTELVRKITHRVSGVLMVVDMIVFGFYTVLFKRGRGILFEILPKKRDFTDFFGTIIFLLKGNKRKLQPRYGVFNFGEKFEFWALIWGTVIMLISGIILWFPKLIPDNWPSWVFSIASIVHYFEAILATLAIIIWHFFFVIFHPDEYPMNTSWLTGYITEKEAKHRFEEDAIIKMKLGNKKTKKDKKN